MQEHINLPIILDPSHAMGYAYGVTPLAKACVAMGIDGLLIEAHPNPKVAKSDASQQLDHAQFKNMLNGINSEAVYAKLEPVFGDLIDGFYDSGVMKVEVRHAAPEEP